MYVSIYSFYCKGVLDFFSFIGNQNENIKIVKLKFWILEETPLGKVFFEAIVK